MRSIIDDLLRQRLPLAQTNIDKLHRLAETLLEKETIEADEVERLISDSPAPAKAPAPPEDALIPERAAAATQTPKEEKSRVSPSVLPFPPPEPA